MADGGLFTIQVERLHDETHDWGIVEYHSPTRRSERCRRCGMLVSALLHPFGILGWQRGYPDGPPCLEA